MSRVVELNSGWCDSHALKTEFDIKRCPNGLTVGRRNDIDFASGADLDLGNAA